MINQITEAKQMIGRTIELVKEPECSSDDLLIKFTDGSFVAIEKDYVGVGYDDSQQVMINTWKYQYDDKDLVDIGVITKKQEEERKIREAQQEKDEKIIRLAYAKRTIRELKEQFGDALGI